MRRGNGEGSITKTKTGYSCRISVPTPEGLARISVRARTQKGSVEDGNRLRRHFVAIGASPVTVAEWATHWESVHLPGCATSTQDAYRSDLHNHILPRFGDRLLAAISTMDVEAFTRDLGASHKPRTVGRVLTVLGMMFRQAIASLKALHNPVSAVKRPKIDPVEHVILDADQVRRLLRTAARSRITLGVYLLIDTGMRLGECLGLQWQDISIEREELTVNHTVTKTSHGLEVKPPKTRSSRRTIELSEPVVRMLAAVPSEKRVGYVVGNRSSGPMNPDRFRQEFARLVERAGLTKAFTPHKMRHTNASHHLTSGVDGSVVRRRLGHSSIAITDGIYGHMVKGEQTKAVRVSARLIGGRR